MTKSGIFVFLGKEAQCYIFTSKLLFKEPESHFVILGVLFKSHKTANRLQLILLNSIKISVKKLFENIREIQAGTVVIYWHKFSAVAKYLKTIPVRLKEKETVFLKQ